MIVLPLPIPALDRLRPGMLIPLVSVIVAITLLPIVLVAAVR